MGFADLHIHSIYSSDGSCSVEAILAQAHKRQLDVIAITDHNSMEGVLEAMVLMERYQLQVIPGIEISTADGHLLAYEITRPIPKGRRLVDTVLEVRGNGGFCIIPHPMGPGKNAVSPAVLAEALTNPLAAETILGIEVINGGLFRRNRRAKNLPAQFNLAAVGNSDGHNIDAIGRAVTVFKGSRVQDLKQALQQRNTSAHWFFRTVDPLYYAEHISFQLLRKLGVCVGIDEKHSRLSLCGVSTEKNEC